MNQLRCVALTGADTFFGRRLVGRWSDSESDARVVCLDAGAPQLAEILEKEGVESLVHLELSDIPAVGSERHYADELRRTRMLLDACAEAQVGRLVIPSSTMCYGPRLENPQHLLEDATLHGHPDAGWVSNRVQIEQAVARFREDHPASEVTVLRHCWIVGPRFMDAVIRYFEADWVPTLLGYDPLMQFVHEDDVLELIEESALESHPGVFNVVGEGVLPLSGYLRLANKWNVPTPRALLGFASGVPVPLSNSRGAQGFSDYMKYIWVASGERAAAEFGPRTYTSQEAWLAMIGARRLHHFQTRK